MLTPEANEEEAAAAVDVVTGFISDRGGSVSVQENWGVRRLAYPVQRFQEGNYFLMRFELDAKEPGSSKARYRPRRTCSATW